MPERRWRSYPNLDPAYMYEEADPDYHAADSDENDGWRPLVHLWKWTYGPVDPPRLTIATQYQPVRRSDTPWRTHHVAEGPRGPRRDFGSPELAKQDAEAREAKRDVSPALP